MFSAGDRAICRRFTGSAGKYYWRPVTGQMILKGTLVQSQSGETQPLGFFRGEYSSSYTYYEGDEVTCQGSTCRFIYSTPQTGKPPADTTYRTVVAAKGEPGANGQA